ncbi:MAG: ABC transporter permease [Chloroflexi bacterium]|nr:ABC transporter permease [Chloroflexota bacterium]
MDKLIGFLARKKYHLTLAALLALTGHFLVSSRLLGNPESVASHFYLFLLVVAVFFGLLPLYLQRRLTSFYWARTKKNRLAIPGLAFIILLALVALIGPFFTQDPTRVDFNAKNTPPVGFSIERSRYDAATGKLSSEIIYGSWEHPLGTDDKGRDLLAMIVSGTRVSLQVGLLATGLAILIGTIVGVSSAYFGGWLDNAIQRFTDVMMTFPFFLLLVLIVYLFGSNLTFIVIMIGLTGWTGTNRLVRSEALSLRSRDFVLAARALGASDARIVFRHLIPNVLSSIIVIATLSIPGIILAESALSFIGLGDPTVSSWGLILRTGQATLDTAWWIAVEPGIMLVLTVLAFNFLGDALRDAFDPRSNL